MNRDRLQGQKSSTTIYGANIDLEIYYIVINNFNNESIELTILFSWIMV